MGWLFGYHTRKELIDHLIFDNGVKTLKYCLKGNNLWAVHESIYTGGPKIGQTARYVVLYMLRGGNKERTRWGYKDIDVDSGPNYCNCPLSYLDGLDEAVSHGIEWRERVRKYWAARNQKLLPGQRIRFYDREYTVEAKVKGGYHVLLNDLRFRIRTNQIEKVEVVS